jgi:hypothetical protein
VGATAYLQIWDVGEFIGHTSDVLQTMIGNGKERSALGSFAEGETVNLSEVTSVDKLGFLTRVAGDQRLNATDLRCAILSGCGSVPASLRGLPRGLGRRPVLQKSRGDVTPTVSDALFKTLSRNRVFEWKRRQIGGAGKSQPVQAACDIGFPDARPANATTASRARVRFAMSDSG